MSAYNDVLQFLDRQELKYKEHPENDCVIAGFGLENCSLELCIKVDSDRLLSVYGRVPNRAPKGCRPAIAEVLTRANYGMRVGNFQMDMNDGEILFHASSLVSSGALSTIFGPLGDLLRSAYGLCERQQNINKFLHFCSDVQK